MVLWMLIAIMKGGESEGKTPMKSQPHLYDKGGESEGKISHHRSGNMQDERYLLEEFQMKILATSDSSQPTNIPNQG
eukprot:5247818-Ditylum_brightwellii.AAC.1